VLDSGKGARLKDIDGKSYLDFFGGILTVSLGQAHEGVNRALHAQIDRLGHTSTLYPNLPIVELAEKLVSLAPGKIKKAFFTASGTEADETAVAAAQIFTGKQELIALRHGYSGRSLLAQSLTAHASYRAIPTQVAAIKHAHAPYCYRCPFGLEYPSCDIRCAKDIEELIQTTTTGHIAGFLAEPIMGVGGFITAPDGYFKIAVDIIKKYGGLFICDEVQTGFGRTGGKMWGIEHHEGVEPDIMTMAKGIANGLPIGATLATAAIADSWKAGNISTFGGNPISATAANATIDTIVSEKLVDNAAAMGKVLRDGLLALQAKYPKTIGDVRGKGLMQALELVKDETAKDRTPAPQATLHLFEETKKRGLLIGKGGLYGNTVRIAPPLNIGKTDVEEALRILDDAFAASRVG
jgi:4-aminobutyrate aminotransferase-like enzyme